MKALILILTLGFSRVVFGMAPDLAAAAALNSANSSARNITDFRSAEDANNTLNCAHASDEAKDQALRFLNQNSQEKRQNSFTAEA